MPTWVITGASHGIGLQVVEDLLARGDSVVALTRSPEKAQDLQKLKTDKLLILKGEVNDPKSLEAAAAETAKVFDSVDVLLNNAAVMDYTHWWRPLDQFPSQEALVADFKQSFDINVLGPILVTNAFLPLLRKGTTKKIIQMATLHQIEDLILRTEFSKCVPYCTSKAAMRMVTLKYAVALKSEGFTVLDVSPGVVITYETKEEDLPELNAMIGQFMKVYPDWKGPLTTAQSAACLFRIIDNCKPEDTGKILSHNGDTEVWM